MWQPSGKLLEALVGAANRGLIVFAVGLQRIRRAAKAERRTEVETEVVSTVRAHESRLARSRRELRVRVPHEVRSLPASKIAQWVEQRSRKP